MKLVTHEIFHVQIAAGKRCLALVNHRRISLFYTAQASGCLHTSWIYSSECLVEAKELCVFPDKWHHRFYTIIYLYLHFKLHLKINHQEENMTYNLRNSDHIEIIHRERWMEPGQCADRWWWHHTAWRKSHHHAIHKQCEYLQTINDRLHEHWY